MATKACSGDFMYDFYSLEFLVYDTTGWMKFMICEVKSLVQNSNGHRMIILFTGGGLPYWKKMLSHLVRKMCNFNNIECLLSHFYCMFNGKLNRLILPATSKITNPETPSDMLRKSGHIFILKPCYLIAFIKKEA